MNLASYGNKRIYIYIVIKYRIDNYTYVCTQKTNLEYSYKSFRIAWAIWKSIRRHSLNGIQLEIIVDRKKDIDYQ